MLYPLPVPPRHPARWALLPMRLAIIAASSAGMGCTAPLETPPLPPVPDSGVAGPTVDAALAADAGASRDAAIIMDAATGCLEGAREACSCGARDDGTPTSGERSCARGAFGPCACGSSGDAGPLAVGCALGDYAGALTGSLMVAGNSYELGSGTRVALHVARLDGRAELPVTGEIQAQSGALVALNGTLAGSLDCTRGTFTASATVSLSVLGVGVALAGPLTANHDPARDAFQFGTWDLIDVSGNSDAANGSGEWAAERAP